MKVVNSKVYLLVPKRVFWNWGLGHEKWPEKWKLLIHLEALPICWGTQESLLKLGFWSEKIDLVVVRKDDFDVYLGWTSFLNIKSSLLSKCIVITDYNPTVIPKNIKQSDNLRMISAL